ncbi:MAG: hypothetical protein CEE38_17145 [Planctomycetes bacterium B3_Pla]|nr:MAG: hypothetical protein CEE38_17145 [Planctomycetes bacterium B3_Pla]
MKSFVRNPFRLVCLLIAAAFLVMVTSVFGADRRPNKATLTIMTLNTEFMWDGVEPEEGQPNFDWKHSETEAAEHMAEIAEIIRAGNPDIVNLVEVENKQAVDKLNADYLAGRGYQVYFKKGKDTYTGQDVALLTRIDPLVFDRDDGKGQSGNVVKGVSKNLYATFTIGNTKIAIIGLHFLAFPNAEYRRLPREAQADLICKRAKKLFDDGYLLIILGDFNDYDGEEGNRDHIDSMPVTNVLSMIKQLGTGTPGDDLFNAAQLVPKASRYTAFWDQNHNEHIEADRELTSIDHILIANGLRERVELVDIPHNHDPRAVTDHFPVVVRLRCEDETQTGTLLIVALLPNPPGKDIDKETATIRNVSQQAINLNGWKLRDLSGKTWSLSSLGMIQPGAEKTITRHGQPMSLNNDGDTIDLIDPDGDVVDSVTYGPVDEDEVVIRGN